MSGKIAEEILNNPQLLSALAEKIYEKLKDEIVIKKLEESTESIKALQEAVKKQGEAIQALQLTVKALQETVDKHTEAIASLQETVKRQGEAIVSLQEAVKKQGEAIQALQLTVKALQETVDKHTEAIASLQETVKRQGEAIVSLQEAVKKQGEAIETLQKAIIKLNKEVKKLSIEVGSFTSRAGKGMERTMLKLYKKALELHGVDPKKVIHGIIIDEEGVIEKGRTFEVDFYETNDYVYVFEIKNLADKGAYDQIIIRKKLFSSKYKNKYIKIFLVANFIEEEVKKKLEEEGIEIIASYVIK
jgi:tetratricopeptide (TPR) repeat protein